MVHSGNVPRDMGNFNIQLNEGFSRNEACKDPYPKTMRATSNTSLSTIRVLNLRYLIDNRFEGNVAALGRAIGKHASYLNRIMNPKSSQPRNVGDSLADDIEEALKLPPRTLDSPMYLVDGVIAVTRAVNIIETIVVDHKGRITPRPSTSNGISEYASFATQDPSAYALRIVSDEARPRFRTGEVLLVEGSPLVPACDVILTLHDGKRLIAEYIGSTSKHMTVREINATNDATKVIPFAEISMTVRITARA